MDDDNEIRQIITTLDKNIQTLDELSGGVSPHTNCWCEPDVLHCSKRDCPRAKRAAVRRSLSQDWRRRLDGWRSGSTGDDK